MAQPTAEIVYPETDGEPMGENTLQIQWIVTLFNGFEAYFRERPDVFVAADLFWYPVEGWPRRVTAPDLMFAFGRPKGHRSSYKQWEEGGIAPQVVIEVLSPSNDYRARGKLLKFYDAHRVEEVYEYDPDARELTVSLRDGHRLGSMTTTRSHTSARLGVRFEVPTGGELQVYGPDGARFRTYHELKDEAVAAQERAVEAQRIAADEARKAAEARRDADRMRAKLRELGLDPDAL